MQYSIGFKAREIDNLSLFSASEFHILDRALSFLQHALCKALSDLCTPSARFSLNIVYASAYTSFHSTISFLFPCSFQKMCDP